MLSVLRGDAAASIGTAPQPTLAGLDGLAAQHRAARGAVGCASPTSAPRCPPWSNCRRTGSCRKASPTCAATAARWRGPQDGAVSTELASDPRRRASLAAATPGPGHGLTGIRERAALFGGTVTPDSRPRAGSGSRSSCRSRGPRGDRDPRPGGRRPGAGPRRLRRSCSSPRRDMEVVAEAGDGRRPSTWSRARSPTSC